MENYTTAPGAQQMAPMGMMQRNYNMEHEGQMPEKVRALVNEIYEHQKDGVEFHSSMVDLYEFLHLKGFKMWQEHQLHEEMEKLKELQSKFIQRHHYMLGPHKIQQYTSIIPQEFYAHAAKDVTKDDVVKETKRSLKEYLRWEEKTLNFLKQKQRELAQMESYAEYIDIREMIEDVAAEIEFVETFMIELESVNYDPSYIQKVQERFCIEFKKNNGNYNYYNRRNEDYGYRQYGYRY